MQCNKEFATQAFSRLPAILPTIYVPTMRSIAPETRGRTQRTTAGSQSSLEPRHERSCIVHYISSSSVLVAKYDRAGIDSRV